MELADLPLVEAGRRIAARELSPVELVDAVLDRIAELEPGLHAFVTVCEDEARREARRLADEPVRGPLHGIPLGIKDLIDTAGVRTTSSSRVRADYVPAADATVVRRLRDAGAIVVGKTHTHEFAYGGICPPTRNAWNGDRVAGGSSGGSGVAVATGMCTAALGTDTGGSIRIPAAFNGIVGLKPTYGRVPKDGVAALAWSLDHVGPMARTVADAAVLLAVIAGRERADRTSAREPVDDYAAGLDGGVEGLRLGVAQGVLRTEIDPQVLAAVDAAAQRLADLGAELVEVEIPHLELAPVIGMAITLAEASSYHQRDLRASGELYGAEVRAGLELGELYLGTHYVNGQRARTLVQDGFRTAFEDARLDGLLVPTMPMTAPPHDTPTVTYPEGETTVVASLLRYGFPFNLSGLPLLTVPCGFDADGLPIGLGIAGRPFAESTVLRIGHAYEQATEWHHRRPGLVAAAQA